MAVSRATSSSLLRVKADGTPVEPSFLENFESLRTTGDWAD